MSSLRSLLPSLVSFVFIDVRDISGARRFFEEALGLSVAENRFHPPHHIHGIVKYDAGSVLLCLNKARPGYDPAASDRARLVLDAADAAWAARAGSNPWISRVSSDGEIITADNHVFRVSHGSGGPRLRSAEFGARDLRRTRDFFSQVLRLPARQDQDALVVPTQTLELRFREVAEAWTDHRAGVFLTVFHTSALPATMEALRGRGMTFLTAAQESRIGWTVRFVDPDGHHYCLYQPSEESLGWESGPTLRRLIGQPMVEAL